MARAPNRRWLQWSLLTFVAVLTVLGIWLGYELNWIRQRHEVLAMPEVVTTGDPFGDGTPIRAPGFLGIFGEQGQDELVIVFDGPGDWPLTQSHRDKIQRIAALFPEAKVAGRGAPTSERE